MSEPVDVRGGTIEQALANGHALLANHPQAALTQAQTLLRLGPDPRVLRLAAAAHRRLGETTEAEAAELAAIQHSLPVPRLKEAARAQHEGRSGDASRLAAEHISEQADDLLAMTISAEAAVSLRHFTEGERILRHVLGRAPTFLRASMLLAQCFALQSRLADAVTVMEKAVERAPQAVAARKLLAQLRADRRDYEGAAAEYERILAQNDRESDIWVSYGDMLRFVGRRTDSELAYRRALVANGASGRAWWGLVDLDPAAVTLRDVGRMEMALADRPDDPDLAGSIHFALGAVFDKQGRHEKAFDHFERGNQLRERAQPYDPAMLTSEVDQSVALFTPEFFDSYADHSAPDESPIFIVGMPRSGSTLVERILGQHSRIEAVGELSIIPRIAERLGVAGGAVGKYRQSLSAIPPSDLRELGRTYVERARELRSSDRHWFTDKLHMNWRHIGLIHMILPNARIIDVRRNALDCCWSNYKMLFTRGHAAASSMTHIGQFYRDYVRMMDHMDEAAPGAILRVRYEDVVADVESETRRMLAFIGAPFEPGYVDFHLSSAPVATASSEQVRQPLNREGIGASAPYAQWLGPLREALGDLADS